MDTPMSEDSKKILTTAEALAKFHQELVKGEVPAEIVPELLLGAASYLYENDGFTVRSGE